MSASASCGHPSLAEANAIAAKLNERNVRTARGGTWTHVQVGAILHLFDGAAVAAV
jgi:Recombinase